MTISRREASFAMTSAAYLLAKKPLADIYDSPSVPFITENFVKDVRGISPAATNGIHCDPLPLQDVWNNYRQQMLTDAAETGVNASALRDTTGIVYIALIAAMASYSESHYCVALQQCIPSPRHSGACGPCK